jgi:hypothetical protein
MDKVAGWLAQRRGEAYDQVQTWKKAITQFVNVAPGEDIAELVRSWVRLLGPKHAAPKGCRWQSGGFEQYLQSLSA